MPTRDDPYPGFNFLVEIDGLPESAFAEVGGIGFATDVIEYRNGSDPQSGVRKLAGLARYSDITLKRGIVGSLDFFKWLRSSADGAPDARRNVAIRLLSEDRNIVMTWRLLRARIIKHTSGPLNARGTDVAMEELVLAYERLEIE